MREVVSPSLNGKPEISQQTSGLKASYGQIFFTGFANQAASEKFQRTGTFLELAAFIKKTSAASKAELPWIKLARFGDTPTDKGCLRHDANVTAMTGVEGDYDAKQQ